MTIAEIILEKIKVDPNYKKDRDIIKQYGKATSEQRKAIDKLFIVLCGHSLRTIIDRHICRFVGFDNTYHPDDIYREHGE